MSEAIETETAETSAREPEVTPWQQRPLILAAIGLGAGLAAHALLGELDYSRTIAVWRLSLLGFVIVSATVFGFVVERHRLAASILFALGCGAVSGLIFYWNGPIEGWSAGEGWRTVSIALAIGIAAPLFQSAEPGQGRWPRFPYPALHDHVWTNAVLFAASWLFVGIVFAMAYLLSELFHLIGLDFLRDLMREAWFWRALIGLAFGTGLGMLREQDRVVRLLQRVVTSVLGVLAPVLAVALIGFLGSLPFTGVDALFEGWISAAMLLLMAAIGSLVLVNAVIGNAPEDEPRNVLLRYGAIGLGFVILPLSLLAAIAIGLRIGQYGFTPERIWAVVFAALACAYGLAYAVSLARGRLGWAGPVRVANLRLAVATCAIAIFLALPILSFNAIATSDQVARISDGRTPKDKIDWPALAYNFGEPGRAAVRSLTKSADPGIRLAATKALEADSYWDLRSGQEDRVDADALQKRLRVLPAGTALPPGLIEGLRTLYLCTNRDEACTAMILDPVQVAIFDDSCFDRIDLEDKAGANRRGNEARAGISPPCADPTLVRLVDREWTRDSPPIGKGSAEEAAAAKAGFTRGDIEVRSVARRQLFVGGVPVGDAFE